MQLIQNQMAIPWLWSVSLISSTTLCQSWQIILKKLTSLICLLCCLHYKNFACCLLIMLGMPLAPLVCLHVSLSKSSKYLCCFPLNSSLTALLCGTSWWDTSYGLIDVLHVGQMISDFCYCLSLEVTPSLSYYLPGKLFLSVFSPSLGFWAIMLKYFTHHFLWLNCNFIYWLWFSAQRRLRFIPCAIQEEMFLVAEHLSFELRSKWYTNVSLTK